MINFRKPRKDDGALELVFIPEQVERGSAKAQGLDLNTPRGGAGLEFIRRDTGGPQQLELGGHAGSPVYFADGALQAIFDLSGACDAHSYQGEGALAYSLNVDRGVVSDMRARHSEARYGSNLVESVMPGTDKLSGSTRQGYESGTRGSQILFVASRAMRDGQGALTSLYCDGVGRTSDVIGTQSYPGAVSSAVVAQYTHALAGAGTAWGRWTYPGKVSKALIDIVASSSAIQVGRATNYQEAGRVNLATSSQYQQAVLPVFGQRPAPPIKPPEPPRPQAPLDFAVLRLKDAHLEFVRIELDAVIIMNQITVFSLNNNAKTPIHPASANLQLDIESYTWTLSGVLHGRDAKQHVLPGSEIEITANGHTWVFLVTSYNRSISGLADVTYSFQAESRTRYLAEPYARTSTGIVESTISPWQIVEQQLQPLGFSLDRSAVPDWTLGANSYSYDSKTPLSLLVEIAKACGAIVQPDKSQDRLTAKPRYRVPPWEWTTLTDEQCDHVIDEAIVINESSEDQSTPEINCVTVLSDSTGVTTELVKSGTVGDLRANDVISPLQQDHAVNAELGRAVIANSGRQSVIDITIPLGAGELIEPGDIVRYAGQTGLCISTGISISSLTDVWQHISLEVHHGN
ncbi:hypothetical protein L1285_16885 [Pseudoalteromonas sp. DL2-H2.2]|uniref:hypothetical protein n=1 Tax=Pseudoalteromonas sp. DL2-H2.2 TaxID=2908889 RepID=UPI001F1AB7DF|nr:hypothetical protein [Pseudoalteromonas sp. DL2-H2.2]MCF2909998.1 hypothetical protein [Pseudoalteromonas sp. DL2-H2.2]